MGRRREDSEEKRTTPATRECKRKRDEEKGWVSVPALSRGLKAQLR